MKKILILVVLMFGMMVGNSQVVYKFLNTDSINSRNGTGAVEFGASLNVGGTYIADSNYNSIASTFGAAYVVLNSSYGDITGRFAGSEGITLNGGTCEGEEVTASAVYYDIPGGVT